MWINVEYREWVKIFKGLKRDFPGRNPLMMKNPPANAGDARDLGSSLGQENPLEREMATHSSILDWRIPWTEEPGGLPSTTERLSTALLVKNRKETQHEETGFSSPTSSGALPFYIYSMTLIVGTSGHPNRQIPWTDLERQLLPFDCMCSLCMKQDSPEAMFRKNIPVIC